MTRRRNAVKPDLFAHEAQKRQLCALGDPLQVIEQRLYRTTFTSWRPRQSADPRAHSPCMAASATLEAKLPQPIDPHFPRAPVGHRIVVDSTSVLVRIKPPHERDTRWHFSLTFEPRDTEDTTDGARAAAPRRNAHQDNLLGLTTQAYAPISSSPSTSHKKPGLTLTLPIRSENRAALRSSKREASPRADVA